MRRSNRVLLAALSASVGLSAATGALATQSRSAGPSGAQPTDAATTWPQFRRGAWHTARNPFETILGTGTVHLLRREWATPIADGAAFSSPAVAGGRVIVGSNVAGELHAVDATTGATLWTAKTRGHIYASPAVVGGRVYVAAWGTSTPSPSGLFAFDASTGALLWSRALGDIAGSSPAVANGLVYVGGGDDGLVHAFDAASGTPVWAASAGVTVFSSPAVADGVVYVGGRYVELNAFDAGTGALVWRTDLPGESGFVDSSPALNGRMLFVTNARRLIAVDRPSGRILWKRVLVDSGGYTSSSPALADGVVFASYVTRPFSGKEHLAAFRQQGGVLLWDVTVGPVENQCCLFTPSSPVVANGVVYFGGGDGRLHAYDATTGQSLANPATDGGISSAPTVVNGRVYVASDKLYAFALPS